MTRKLTLTVLLSSMAVSLVMIILAIALSQNRKSVEAQDILDPTTATTALPTEVGYYLKEYMGSLAVFRGDSPTPFKTLEVSTDWMTDEDKLILKGGIYAKNEQELKSLLEDYTS